MLIILFFLFYDDELERYVHLQSSCERENHVLFYACDYLVDKYVSLYLHLPEEKLLKTVLLSIAREGHIVNLLFIFKFYQKIHCHSLKIQHVDIFFDIFFVHPLVIYNLYTKYSVVDNFIPQGMVVVDKVPKSIAIKGFICYYICVFPFLNIYTYPHVWITCVQFY